MKEIVQINRKDFPIPGTLNIVITVVTVAVCLGILYWTQQQTTWWLFILGAIAFSFANNTAFSLLHEATHGILHKNRRINNNLGRVVAALFPTSFTMQQLYHLGHHRRNRTDAEMFDLYYPGDNIAMKRFVIYGTVFGIYWSSPFISCLFFLVNPKLVLSSEFKDSKLMQALSADHMLGGLDKAMVKTGVVRAEIIFTILFQAAIIYFLGLSWGTWLACYWAFSINWGSLQYADHVGAKRDIREGAWNLKVNPIMQKVFLNYHLHLVHHRYPNLPWIHLPKKLDKNDPMPSFTSKLWEFLSGPRLATEPSPTLDKSFEAVIFDGTMLERKTAQEN
ncbi:fatty acid desaturase [Bdellovibrio bacteriovorus]|uniref:fatty acid desaturase family protein n=1 Tax=Bdellovibrio bacteriovorus TaxID=959 RepID=UPI0035A98C81